jgi:hypothetical protein
MDPSLRGRRWPPAFRRGQTGRQGRIVAQIDPEGQPRRSGTEVDRGAGRPVQQGSAMDLTDVLGECAHGDRLRIKGQYSSEVQQQPCCSACTGIVHRRRLALE